MNITRTPAIRRRNGYRHEVEMQSTKISINKNFDGLEIAFQACTFEKDTSTFNYVIKASMVEIFDNLQSAMMEHKSSIALLEKYYIEKIQNITSKIEIDRLHSIKQNDILFKIAVDKEVRRQLLAVQAI